VEEEMKLKRVKPDQAKGKRVLARVDFNVPIKGGRISDDGRIVSHLEMIDALSGAGGRLTLVSHLGRPKGKTPELSLKPVATRLEELIEKPVTFVHDCIGDEVNAAISSLKDGDILLLENVRFYPQEEKNDPQFAKALALPHQMFVMDAFSAAHRAHASTRGVAEYLPSFAGSLMCREVEILSVVRDDPKHPFALILGGAKVSDKIGVIENMLSKVDVLIIGGGMAFTFLAAQGLSIGRSLCEHDKIDFAKEMLKSAKDKGVKLFLPVDVAVANEANESAERRIVPIDQISEDQMGLDIGPETIKLFCQALTGIKTVLWNGPMGVFELPPFKNGTEAIAKKLSELTAEGALTVVGGGDTAAAIKAAGCERAVSHVSTGGGATLEFMEGKLLPGIEPLFEK
jgi:phosphoglycerate kinase